MEISKPENIVRKANQKISNVAKNTSCSRGWLRLVVQCLFGVITIASFIMILYSTMSSKGPPNRELRCERNTINSCIIICRVAPEFKNYEEDIVFAVSEASMTCKQVVLRLKSPIFWNATMPANWLSNLRSNVHELHIIGGNLNYITPQAFVSPFGGNIQRLILREVTLIRWVSQTLVGLSNLKELIFEDCHLLVIEKHALDAVDNTLSLFSITGSGYFNPQNLTGSGSKTMVAEKVRFTDNNLNTILDRNSLTSIKKCKNLYLNSNRIVTIGAGTFDHLLDIENIFLNNNFIVALPLGIFDTIISVPGIRPRISLENNMWHCDCSNDIPNWVKKGILLVDATCHYPFEIRGQSFFDFIKTCNETKYMRSRPIEKNDMNALSFYYSYTVYDNASFCPKIINPLQMPHYQSPLDFLACPKSNKLSIFELLKKGINKLFLNKENEFIKGKYLIRGNSFSMMEISTAGPSVASNYGLVWFQSDCPEEIHCINTLPSILRVFDVADDVQYTFCPIHLDSGELNTDNCIYYSFEPKPEAIFLRISIYTMVAVLCFCVGAFIVFGIVRKFPYLLKGSDRILFVKHKNVEALVLPPKVPIRNVNSDTAVEVKSNIFILSDSMINKGSFVRIKSSRSAKSAAPSYISALQPTEDQLTEWRLRHHFNNDLSITSGTDVPYLRIPDEDSLYCSIGQVSASPYQSLN